MKKLFTIFSAIFIFGNANAQIPNPSFEVWDTTSLGTAFYVPVGWDNLDSAGHPLSVYTCERAIPGFVGSSYLRLTSKAAGPSVLPGVAVSGKIDYTTGAAKSGFACASRPANLSGEWQYMAWGSDEGFISVLLSKWNATTSRRDTVGFVNHPLTGMAMVWVAFNIPIVYYSGSVPDSAIIVLSASGATPVASSYLYVDTLAFTGSVPVGTITLGTATTNVHSSEISVYPNPAQHSTNVSFYCDAAGNAKISLCDVDGRIVKKTNLLATAGTNNVTISVSDVPRGVYFIKVTDDQCSEVRKLIVE